MAIFKTYSQTFFMELPIEIPHKSYRKAYLVGKKAVITSCVVIDFY